MKYEIGDKIIVQLTKEEGKVVDLINENMVLIEVKGVKFPAYMDQIDFPYFEMFSKKKEEPARKTIYIDQIKREKQIGRKSGKDGVELSFIPILDKDIFEDDVVEKLKVYLINNNDEDYNFKYALFFSDVSTFEVNSVIHKNSEFYLHDINFEDVSDNPKFSFEFSLLKQNKNKAPYFEVLKKLKGKQLFKKVEQTNLKNDASFSYELFGEYPAKQINEELDFTKLNNKGFKVYDLSKIKDHLPPARSVVDLHIERLVDDPSSLTTPEILELQLSTFRKYLELALAHNKKEVTFIHGIGEGRLKQNIHEQLKTFKEVYSFQNTYHEKYGYGATEVFLKQRKQ